MEVRRRFNTQGALSPIVSLLVAVVWEAVWIPQPVSRLRRSENNAPAGNQTPAVQP
jgi:hypothetical protein